MSENPSRLALFEDLLRRTASGVRNAQLYAPDHPLVARNMAGLITVLGALHQQQPSIAVGIVGNDLVVADTPMHKLSATMTELIKKLKDNKVERIAFERGVTQDELVTLVQNLSRLGGKAAGDADKDLSTPHIRVGRLKSDDAKKQDGIASDIAAIRQMYSNAVTSAEALVESAETEGMPDAPAALQTVEGLADAVTQNRTALMALTAMRNYDNYTFTHMVNVSILAMAQARALGIDGKLLREFGMSALMHDIGKVRTPKEILNKPAKLTDDEFVIMRRHVVDGAEILRRTPEMPILAPIVAFEHHLRLDGSGYPFTVKRSSLNLGSMLCAIADVYDAMRSQRAYQQAYPTDRILAVLKRNEGAQLDQHLVRRFVQLLGIYPPGTLVRLSTGETAVVLRIHAPDPHRPRVRVLFGADGVRLDLPFERNLWEVQRDRDDGDGALETVASPVDPADYNLDPLTFLEN
jgi:putative nucleotidyltransferase with HDIG domain